MQHNHPSRVSNHRAGSPLITRAGSPRMPWASVAGQARGGFPPPSEGGGEGPIPPKAGQQCPLAGSERGCGVPRLPGDPRGCRPHPAARRPGLPGLALVRRDAWSLPPQPHQLFLGKPPRLLTLLRTPRVTPRIGRAVEIQALATAPRQRCRCGTRRRVI